MTGGTEVTVYYFTWHDAHLGHPVQAPRPATLPAILAAGGEPLLHTARLIPEADINEIGFKRRPLRHCDECGAALRFAGTVFVTVPRPRRDQVFQCPQGHQGWAFVDQKLEWRRTEPELARVTRPDPVLF